MNRLIDAALNRWRAVVLLFIIIIATGSNSYLTIPREDRPDVQIPFIYVAMAHEGISPEDAERLLLRPMETELKSIEGIKEMRSSAVQGHASVVLEFHAGFDSDKALLDVREKVDLAKSELPEETEEPTVHEINLSRFPVLSVILTSNIPERALIKIARNLRDHIEGISSVLSVDIANNREESVEIIIDPLALEGYNLTSEIIGFVSRNNTLIAAGEMDTGDGRFAIKVPGLLENIKDILDLPLKASDEATVTVKDVGTIRTGFKDPEGYARVNGRNAIVLEVSKRSGENIIDTIDKVRNIVNEQKALWPAGINVVLAQDKSGRIQDIVRDLQNNVVFATLLVMIVVIAVIGWRSGLLVAASIPGAFLFGILIIAGLNLTLNIVVLFSLILSIGMLVDAAIVVVEYANRKMLDGVSYREAYGEAAKRMAWPLIASTVTTLMVFAPLLFWPGIMGQFMKYMPLTLIATLSGSLLMAIIILPALGRWLGKPDITSQQNINIIHATESGDLKKVKGFTGRYIKLLQYILQMPIRFTLFILILTGSIFGLYTQVSVGTEFFPSIEPDNALVQIRARGNLSIQEKDSLVQEVESKITDMTKDISVFYARSGNFSGGGSDMAEDVIGIIQLELSNWETRRKAHAIMDEIKKRTADIPGIIVDTMEENRGPGDDVPIKIEVSSKFPELINPVAQKIVDKLHATDGLTNIEDNRPVPAIEWLLDVDRRKAAQFGIDIITIGNFIRLVTNGLKATSYRPNDSDDEVDVVIRFPKEKRTLEQLSRLRVITSAGNIPIGNFVTHIPQPTISRIDRTSSNRVITVKADTALGVLANTKVSEATEWIKEAYANNDIDPRVQIAFKGDQEDQKETGDFLTKAFLGSIIAMTLILLIQFNNIWHTFIIMSAIILSTTGVLIGLMVTSQPFGIVMCGVGIIALAGIVVNNNIIFIDTYRMLRKENIDAKEAIIRTGAQRLRPILLTAGTTVLGLLPMVAAMNIDFVTRSITFGAPSSQWWQQLSTSIAGGLAFATILTLFLTPSLLLIGEKISRKR